MLSSNEDIGVAIDSFRSGATDYVVKGANSWKKLSSAIYKVITYPIRVLVKEFGVNKFLAIFLLTFVLLGAVVLIALKFIR